MTAQNRTVKGRKSVKSKNFWSMSLAGDLETEVQCAKRTPLGWKGYSGGWPSTDSNGPLLSKMQPESLQELPNV